MKLSKAANNLEGQEMFKILAKTKELESQGKEILHFELGDPNFKTTDNISNAVMESLRKSETHYAPSTGIKNLKEIVSKHISFNPSIDQILITAGANIQIYYALACLVNPGDDVIVPDPGFVSYYSILKFLGVNAIRVPLREENEFRMVPQHIYDAITPNTKAIILNSPSNPTGSITTFKDVCEIYRIAERFDLAILSDEVYDKIIYEGDHFSPSLFDKCQERVIVINSFSKTYSMTGFRLGYCIGPKRIIEKMGLLLETTSSCVSPFIQRAGIEAMTGCQRENMWRLMRLKERRDVLVYGLNSIRGISCLMPKGAFYVFPNIQKTLMTSSEITDLLLDYGVAVTPGNVFGEEGEGFIRMSYTANITTIYEAIYKMKAAFETI